MTTPVDCLVDAPQPEAVPLWPVDAAAFAAWLQSAPAEHTAWAQATGFAPKAGELCLLPGDGGALAGVLAGVAEDADPFALGDLATRLPENTYVLRSDWSAERRAQALLGFALGAYRFQRYREPESKRVRMSVPADIDADALRAQAAALYLARDLINTPAEDMMPPDLSAAAQALGHEFDAHCHVITGEELLEQGYPAIHAVGRASAHAPRLIDLTWGEPAAPTLVLVGKGVCFDSGGLDIKPAAGMRLMKKDMGGAAHALGLAHMIMSAGLSLRLRVLIPAVENAVAGNALRPGDVVRTRKGLSVEIDNTDAEGRVILADALAEAGNGAPQLVLDFATLTGAARVAVGTEIAAMFTNDDTVADAILAAAARLHDPVWRLPLHPPYATLIESSIADIANSAKVPHGGAITAALFLARFAPENTPWAHFDIMAWNTRARPGRPEGGEAMGLRAVFDVLSGRFPR